MLSNETVRETLQVTTVGDRLYVRVGWDRAEEWQTRLRQEGILSTLQLDPVSREAHLEIWPDTEAGQVQAALEKLGA